MNPMFRTCKIILKAQLVIIAMVANMALNANARESAARAINQVNIGLYDRKLYVVVSEKNHKYLELSDGTPFIPIGPNICWPRFETTEKEGLEKMRFYFSKLQENQCNYTRIWLSAPFFEIEEKVAGKYDLFKLRRLDSLVQMASDAGVKIKFCIENFRQLTDSPSKFAGSVPFDRPVYAIENGGPLLDINEFFSSAKGKELYLERLKFFANRYRTNPTIMGWELWNEINSVKVSNKPQILYDWTEEMLAKTKDIFPKHLVMQSMGSFDNDDKRNFYRTFCTMPGNKIAQVHRYLDPGAILEICKGPMDILAADAVREILSFNPGKPVVLSEVGAVEAHHAGPSKLYEVDKKGVLLHDLLFAPFFSGAAAPGQSWHWHFYIEKNNLWWHFGRFNQAIKGVNPIEEDFHPVFFEDSNLRNYILNGKNLVLIWCRDKASDWKSELVEGKEAEKLNKLSVDLSGINIPKNSSVEYYLPWNDQWMKGKSDGRKVILPEFTRSIVIRITKK